MHNRILLAFAAALLLFTFAAAQETRFLDLEFSELEYYRHEIVTITVSWNGEPVAGADVNIVFGEEMELQSSDGEGKLELQLNEPGVYFFELGKTDGNIIYEGEGKLSFIIDPGLMFENNNGTYKICFLEPIASIVVSEGEEKATLALDEEHCANYKPSGESFTVSTLYSKEYMERSYTIDVEPAEVPKPETPAETGEEQQVVEDKVPDMPETPQQPAGPPDYTLPAVAGVVALVLVLVGLFRIRNKRRMRW